MKSKAMALLLVAACVSGISAQSLDGRWNATVDVKGAIVPFRFDIANSNEHVTGSFFNGTERVVSTSGTLHDGLLVLKFDAYAATLEASLKDGHLEGHYARGTHSLFPFQAQRYVSEPAPTTKVPDISGDWELQTQTRYGESSLLLVVHQSGAQIDAAISRVDGDTGSLDGSYKDGKFVLGHFDGARPLLLDVTPAPDGSLHIIQNGQANLVAWRPAAARARGLAAPVDPTQHTHVQDPEAPLRFSFSDLNGNLVTNNDERFHHKVVLVVITGSWCPNCHDETPFLVSLYQRYRSRGLEIVGLSFEEADQLKDPTRLKAFIKQDGIDYTVLLAGEPDQIAEKLPQAVNLDAIPTTFFLDREGRVRSIHAGFAGVPTGDVNKRLQQATIDTIEHLLAESPGVANAQAQRPAALPDTTNGNTLNKESK